MTKMERKAHGAAPEIVSADDLLAKMRSGVKEVFEINLRGFTIPVRVISMEEVQAIRREAMSFGAAHSWNETDVNAHIQKTTLKLASGINHGGVPLLGDKLLSKMTLDEIQYLFEEYLTVLDSVNPTLETISPEQFQSIVLALKKNTISSKDCSLRQLRAICSAYVDLIQRQETHA